MEEAKPGELRVAPRAMINQMPEERKEEEPEQEPVVVPLKPILRTVAEPGSRLLFGRKKVAAPVPGFPQQLKRRNQTKRSEFFPNLRM